MKRNLIFTVCIVLALTASAQRLGDFSHWSFTLEGGANRFNGDIKQDYGKKVLPTADTKLAVGGALEYTLTPAWSIGLDYYYLPLGADTRPDGGYYSFETKMHNVSFFTSFNAIKAFLPKTNTRWGLWGGIGVGYSMHDVKYETDNADGVLVNTKWGKFSDADYTNPDGRAVFIPVHLLVEYNISKNFAIGARAQYRGFFVDDLEGRFRPNANDAVDIATLQLRWKFCAQKKDHTRNINMARFADLVSYDDIDQLQRNIDAIVIPADNTDQLNDLDNRVRKLEDYLDIDGPDDDNDGVANSRDQEPNTPAGTQVDFWGRTIPKNTVFEETALIYFDFDKTDLDEEAYKAIRIAANKLMDNPELLIEVRGFTDNMGNNAYNSNLSQRRADKIKSELINLYGIEANRIIANGKGKFNPEDKVVPYRPYRTCVLFYSK